MLQNMSSQLDSMRGNDEKIVAVEKKLDKSVQENKEGMEALEKNLNEKIRSRDQRVCIHVQILNQFKVFNILTDNKTGRRSIKPSIAMCRP